MTVTEDRTPAVVCYTYSPQKAKSTLVDRKPCHLVVIIIIHSLFVHTSLCVVYAVVYTVAFYILRHKYFKELFAEVYMIVINAVQKRAVQIRAVQIRAAFRKQNHAQRARFFMVTRAHRFSQRVPTHIIFSFGAALSRSD